MPSNCGYFQRKGRIPFGRLSFLTLLVTVGLISMMLSTAAFAQAQPNRQKVSNDAAKSRAVAMMSGLPLGFEPNRGQMDSAVKYAAKGSQYSLFLTSSEAVFVLPERLELPSSVKSIAAQTAAHQTSRPSSWTSIVLQLVGAHPTLDFSATNQLPGKKNYYIGRDKTRWAAAVPLYSRVQANEIYPGIDIAFRSITRELEFDFVVNPHADPKRIKVAFKGARRARIDGSGNVVLSSSAGDLKIHRPLAYQDTPDGQRKLVDVRFAQSRNGEVRLALGRYDRRRELVIDPSVTYTTYLGGDGQDEGLGIAVDDAGDSFVTGATASADFPNTGGGYNYAGGFDVFVTEFNSSGQLIFSTLVGGSGDDVGTSIAVNPGGIYVTGYTDSDDFPAGTNFCGTGCFPIAYGTKCGTQNAFVFVLNGSGVYNAGSSAYLGGSNSDAGLAITADTAYGEGFSYIYIAGETTSPDFASCFPLGNDSQINMGHGSGPSDGFVTKLAESFGELWFSTFLGGSNQDFAAGIALDKPASVETNIYITGGTNSPDFYTTPGAFQPTCGTDGKCNGGQDDAFVTVLCTYAAEPCNANVAPNYVHSTFLGGSGKDDAYSIAADMSGNAYLTGQTSSSDFKLQNPFQGALKGAQNGFVSKMNPAGTALVFSTYLGGSKMDAGLGIAIDPSTNVYVTGRTNSPDFPLFSPTQSTIGGGNDAFISAFNLGGNALTFSTFLGGSGDEDVIGGGIAADSVENVYVTGDTNSTDFPTKNAYQGSIGSTQNCTINGNQVLCPDAFVAKLNVPPPNYATLNVTINGGPSGALGSVSSMPAGIDMCSDDPNNPGVCTASFPLGTNITLTATPFQDQFGGWGGDAPASCAMNLTCEFQLAGNMNVTATFNPVSQLYNLTVTGIGLGSSPGTGTVTSNPGGIDCGTVCSFNFAAGTQVTLTATPDPGSYFYGWSSTQNPPLCSGTGSCVVVMNSNITIGYTFLANGTTPPQPDFTITISPPSLGTVPVGGQGVAGIAIGTLNNFTDTVNLSCSVLPASASSPTCTVTPSSLDIPVGGAGNATLAVNTSGLTAARKRPTVAALAIFFPFLGTLISVSVKSRCSRRTRNWLRLLLCVGVLSLVSFQVACGSSGGRSSGGLAQPGTYTVVVNAQGATTPVFHTAQVTITVQ